MTIPTPAQVLQNAEFMTRVQFSLDTLRANGRLTDENVTTTFVNYIHQYYGLLRGTQPERAAFLTIFAALQDRFREYYSAAKQADVSASKYDFATKSDDFSWIDASIKAVSDEAGGILGGNGAVLNWVFRNGVSLAIGAAVLVALIKYRKQIIGFLK